MIRNLEHFAPYLLNRIMARYNSGLAEVLAPHGINVPQMRTLAVLSQHGPCTINHLSVLTVIKQSTLSRTLDTMEAASLVRRAQCENDSRVRHIHLTRHGRTVLEQAWPAMELAEARLFADIPDEDSAAFTETLTRILHSIRHHDF